MVQVDVVWSYAFGASFAAAATHQLKRESRIFDNRYYVRLLIFLGIFFAPSGLYLLWQFPQWETMQVARAHSDIPSWLVVLFGVTNVTQGILGYMMGYQLSRRGAAYWAHVNWITAWTIFWFILVAGWDLTGYQRFLYDATMNLGEPWKPGQHMGIRFFTGNVFQSLVIMGILFLPMLNYGIIAPILESRGLSLKDGRNFWRERGRIAGAFYGTAFGLTLAMAIGAFYLVRALVSLFGDSLLMGYLIGIPSSAVIYYFLLFRPGRPMHRLCEHFIGKPRQTLQPFLRALDERAKSMSRNSSTR